MLFKRILAALNAAPDDVPANMPSFAASNLTSFIASVRCRTEY